MTALRIIDNHTELLNVGSNTHAQIDTHIASASIHFTVGSIDHGSIAGLADDDHPGHPWLLGRAGGQTLQGSTLVNEDLTLSANPVAGVNTGRIQMNSGVEFNSIAATGAPYAFNYNATESYVTFIGGGLNMSGNINFTGGTFIYESFRGAPIITSNAAPGFAAYTVLQALPNLQAGSGATHNPLSPLILNAAPRCANGFAGTRTTGSMAGVNWGGVVQTTVSGATMNVTAVTGLISAPKYSTVAGSTVNFGTVRGVHVQNITPALFAPSAGTELMTAHIGLDVENLSFGAVSNVKAAVRSRMTSHSVNAWFLLNDGNAHSDHGAGHIYFDDNAGIAYGQVSNSGFDVWQTWNAAGYFRTYFNSGFNDELRWSNPDEGRILFDNNNGNTSGQYTFNCNKFSFGAQTGANGNSIGQFVSPARATAVNGGWVDMSFSQAGNLTINHAMSDVSAFNIASISLTLGTGSITGYITSFNVGMTTSGVTGVETSAIRPNGRIHHRGVMETPPLTPGVLGASANNYSPATFNSMRQIWRVASSLAVNITGIAIPLSNNPADTQWLTNVGSFAITLTHQDAASTASNRFISPTGANYVVGPDESACLWHDPTTDRWRILWGTGA